ncbi:MAG: NmrA family transcriptional regulator [Thermoleophilia bacterium]
MTPTRTTSETPSIPAPVTTGRVLITSGGGMTARRIAPLLWDGDRAVRLASRTTTPPLDWADPSTYAAALEGVDAAWIAYQPDLVAPGAPEAIGAFTDAAVRAGVRRLVILSGRGEPAARECEDIVRASGLEWTALRCSLFAQNFGEGHLLGPILDGVVAIPVPDVPEPFVDVDDVAEAAVVALTQPGHAGRAYEITGPRALTFAEATAAIGAASGRPVRALSVTPAEYEEALAGAGLPAGYAAMLTGLFTEVLDGRNRVPQDGVQALLGRPPRDFADYVRHTAATGMWSAS